MATKKKKTNPHSLSNPPQSRLSEKISPGFLEGSLARWFFGGALLIVLSLAWDNFNGGGISCWPTKKIALHQISHFSGNDQKCGTFLVGGLCVVNGGKIIVSDVGKKRFLLFDLKGAYLGEADMKTCSQLAGDQVLDPKNNLRYIADRDYRRMKVMDASGKLLRMIPLRDRPFAIGLDSQRRIFISFANYNSVQVFSSATGKFLGDLAIDNAGADHTYMNITHFCLTEDGLLVAADRFSVRVFQSPPLK